MKRIGSFIFLATFLCPVAFAQDWTKTRKGGGDRAMLHDAAQLVRGDSGKWSDDALLQPAPPIERKPAKTTLDGWTDLLVKKKVEVNDKDDCWLLYRTDQLNDNDRIWVERIERRGKEITVTASLAKWQGKYFRNFTCYHVIGVNLGKLEPGKYEVTWTNRPLVFSKFDGDGKALDKNWPKDERPADKKPAEIRTSLTVNKKP